jgi:hypothetical protein
MVVFFASNEKVSCQSRMQESTILFNHNGKVVLVLDQQISQLLGNKTIDLMTDDDGSHLILKD